MGGGRTDRFFGLATLAFGLALLFSAPATALESVSTMFESAPQISNAPATVAADRLTYDADAHKVLADGHVVLHYDQYVMSGDHLVFDQRAHTAHFVGNVVVQTPQGETYTATDLQLSGPLRRALMQQLTMRTIDGAYITADDGEFDSGTQAVLNNGTYSPCGQCIDAKGRKIGWSAKAAQLIFHNKTRQVELEQPTIYLLGVPMAWLPWLTLPDPKGRSSGFRMPTFNYTGATGARVGIPYFFNLGDDTDLLFAPVLMSRQGLLLAAQLDQRFTNGAVQVRASVVSQRDPAAFAGQVGDRDWRGAAQISGRFTPARTWTVGWSYTAFTDANYFNDYGIDTDKSLVNEVYATRLTQNEFIDFRLQQFNLLGNVTSAQQDQQALALPNARYRNVLYLPQQMGELDLSASLLGVKRAADDDLFPSSTLNGVPYIVGYAGEKAHATAEADWQKRWVVPGGVAVTPFAGLRADAAYYNGASTLNPGAVDLLTLTPIAAVDVRMPLVARSNGVSQVIEPIGQLVYRASDVTAVGITNDNAQSFVFDDTNLFSYNRFSGTDRQETGLRANLGGHYQANFDNGNWLDLIGGESFQLAGPNAFAAADPTEVTTGQGLTSSASYVVLGATGSPITGITLGSKLQVDPATPRVTRAGLSGAYAVNDYKFNIDYLYVAQDVARGVLRPRHEVIAGATVPIMDYWKADAHAGWDIATNNWLVAGVGAHYDDGYLRYGAEVEATGPTNRTPNNFTISASLDLKGLGGVATH
jgi:LPS-assembly protein